MIILVWEGVGGEVTLLLTNVLLDGYLVMKKHADNKYDRARRWHRFKNESALEESADQESWGVATMQLTQTHIIAFSYVIVQFRNTNLQ
jgi:hypothetical protein